MFKRLKNIENAQKNKIKSKLLKVFDYLKSWRQKAKVLMDEIEDAENDIDIYKLAFIGSNKKN